MFKWAFFTNFQEFLQTVNFEVHKIPPLVFKNVQQPWCITKVTTIIETIKMHPQLDLT